MVIYMNQAAENLFQSNKGIYPDIERIFNSMSNAWNEVDCLFADRSTPYWSRHAVNLLGGILDDLTRLAMLCRSYGNGRIVTFKKTKKSEQVEGKWSHWSFIEMQMLENKSRFRTVHQLYDYRNDYAHVSIPIAEEVLSIKALNEFKSFLGEMKTVFDELFEGESQQ